MKSANNAGVESIFDGKRKFHKAMANLPIEKKIMAVAALQRIDYSIRPAAWKKRMMWPSDGGMGAGSGGKRGLRALAESIMRMPCNRNGSDKTFVYESQQIHAGYFKEVRK